MKEFTDGSAQFSVESAVPSIFDMLHPYPENTEFKGLSNVEWSNLGVFICYYTEEGKIDGQPTRYGQLINLPPGKNSTEAMQIWIEQHSGKIFSRGGNGSSAGPVKDIPFKVCGGGVAVK